ncbi:MAG: radical SAM protein [Bacteroidales bacterium]|nr:radical SAM protein [Bacteroidales bacterium]
MNEYQPISVVWELTSECNFKCAHCYNKEIVNSAAIDLEKAMEVCEQLAQLKVKAVLLSGGEVLLSGIWPSVALRLSELGVKAGILSNGWLFDEDTLTQIIASNIDWVGFSIDGLEETHDSIRQKGSFKRIFNSLRELKGKDIYTAINTTVNKRNIGELPALHSLLCEFGVKNWLVQLSVTEGTLEEQRKNFMLDPEQIDSVIDFAHSIYKDSPVNVYLGDCVGHYNAKEIEVRSYRSLPRYGLTTFINGCAAGKSTFGIKANGDITGCIALTKNRFVEGNLYERTLWDIWHDENSFAWNRKMSKDSLVGFCHECQYSSYCLGGCPSLKYNKDFKPVENIYCSYSCAYKKEQERISKLNDSSELIALGREAKQHGNPQIANAYFKRALELEYDPTIEKEIV